MRLRRVRFTVRRMIVAVAILAGALTLGVEAEEGPRPVPGLRRPFDAPLRAPAVATGDPELDPLVSYLKASFAAQLKDGRRLVITLSTGERLVLHPRQTYQELVDELRNQGSKQV